MKMSFNNFIDQIAAGNLETALNELIADIGDNSNKKPYLNDAITIKSRLNQHNRSVIRGTLGYGEQVLEKNQIAFAILDLLNTIYDKNKASQEVDREPESVFSTGTITILFVTANPEQT